jgi:hypothetical protein
MAKGDAYFFQEAMFDLGKAVHNLSTATLKAGFIDNTTAPTRNDATPRWADYSANEVATTGNYTANGETLTTVSWALTSGVATLTADDVTILENASGFTDAYWVIIYNDSATNDEALCYIDLGGPESEQAGDVTVEFSSGIVFQLPANALTWQTPAT